VLVWQDMAGLRAGRVPRFVKIYADLRGTLAAATQAFAADVVGGTFPTEEHSYR
jgi:3-methyl-2-oxobutanoate hydroxymethyltransferase